MLPKALEIVDNLAYNITSKMADSFAKSIYVAMPINSQKTKGGQHESCNSWLRQWSMCHGV